jgi:hypothetical protein
MKHDFAAFLDKFADMGTKEVQNFGGIDNAAFSDLIDAMKAAHLHTHIEESILLGLSKGAGVELTLLVGYAWLFTLGCQYERERRSQTELEKMLHD